MLRRLWPAVLLVFLIAVFGPYAISNRETQVLDGSMRATLGGDYRSLPDGVTHYELSGPPGAPLVVLIHGATVPLFTWDAQQPALLQAGFRVLRYDHFGRGLSDRPKLDYDRALYQKQLDDLLSELEIDEPLSLVGVSFGGAIAATFAKNHPDRVSKLVFISPMLDYAEDKGLVDLAKAPVFGDWFARVFLIRAAIARANGFFDETGADGSYAARFEEQTRYKGFEQSLLSMFRSDALTSYRDTYAALGYQPKLLIWGTNDTEIPFEHVQFVRENAGNVSFAQIEGARHGVNLQRAAEVNQRIIEFLQD